ncbi:hypothetical protein IWQ56_004891 [Coemansia nantahalensis]|nr:hypothetical protein IWQ56_004891 [Coemansia nantahalensis]
MKLAALSVALAAASSLVAPAAAAPASLHTKAALDIDYQCAFRITYKLLDYVNSWDANGGKAYCGYNDNSGYLVGIGRFTTRWSSALAVVDNYIATPHYKGEFKDLYGALKEASLEQTASVDKLAGFCDAWGKAAANGNHFYFSQIAVIRSMYEAPTKPYWKKYRIRLPLTRAAIISTAMANGLGETGKTVGAVIARTNAKFSGNVSGKSGNSVRVGGFMVDEIAWLSKFLDSTDELAGYAHKEANNVFRSLIRGEFYTLSSEVSFTDYKDRCVVLTCRKLSDRVNNSS